MSNFFRKFFLTYAFCVFAECLHAANLKNGDFISEEYLQILSQSNSPLRASKSSQPQLIKVKSENESTTYKTILDFNEAGPVFEVGKNSQIKLREGRGLNPTIVKIDSTHLLFGYEGYPKKKFQFVDNLERLVSEQVLTGSYSGTKNEKVQFSLQGQFVVNNKKMNFKIGLFYPPSFHYDYISCDSIEYGYLKSKDTLRIYSVMGGSLFEDGTLNTEPDMILLQKK